MKVNAWFDWVTEVVLMRRVLTCVTGMESVRRKNTEELKSKQANGEGLG